MKRIASILLMLLYLVPSIGVTVSKHYCGGKVTSVSFSPIKMGHKCPCGSKKMKKGCCKDEAAFFKLSDEQQKTQQLARNVVKITDFQSAISSNLAFYHEAPPLSTLFNRSSHPPDNLKLPLYIRYRVFLI